VSGKQVRFIGIGAQRAGTSWLYNCLNEHPEIYMPKKEVHFFDKSFEKGIDWYKGLFAGLEDQHLAYGEFTPDYMDDVVTMERIRSFDKDVKLIVMLRNPIERSISAFKLYQSHGRLQGASFSQGVNEYEQLITKSLYAKQLDIVYSLFPEENVFIGIYDDIESNPLDLYKSACSFLEVDESFVPKSLTVRSNSSVMSDVHGVLDITDIQNRIHRSFLGPAFVRLKRTAPVKKLKELLITNAKNKEEKISLPSKYIKMLESDIDELEVKLNRDFNLWKEAVRKSAM
jgi:hypothetical protein